MNADEKKCPFCAEVIKSEAVVCRFCNKSVAGKSAPGKKKGGGLFSLLLFVAVLGYLYWTPYGTLHSLKNELKEGQVDKLDQVIDYAAVREGLKNDFRALAMGEVEDDPSLKNKLLGVLGLALGEPVVDPVVDYVVSPAGLRDVLAGSVPVLSHRDTAYGEGGADNAGEPKSKTDCHYADLNEFVATITSPAGSATRLTFTRKGLLSWRLTHIKLMPSRR